METVGNGVSWRAHLKIRPRIRRDKETKMISEEVRYERHKRNLQNMNNVCPRGGDQSK